MRLLGYLFVGLVALAILRVAFQVVAIVVLVVVLWCAVARPRETAAFVFMFVAVSLIGHFPVAGLAVFGCLALVGLLGRRDI